MSGLSMRHCTCVIVSYFPVRVGCLLMGVCSCLAAVALLAVVGTSSQADEPEQWSELASVLPGSGDEDSIETAAEVRVGCGFL